MRKVVFCPNSDGTDFKNHSKENCEVQQEFIQLSMIDLMESNQQVHFPGTIDQFQILLYQNHQNHE